MLELKLAIADDKSRSSLCASEHTCVRKANPAYRDSCQSSLLPRGIEQSKTLKTGNKKRQPPSTPPIPHIANPTLCSFPNVKTTQATCPVSSFNGVQCSTKRSIPIYGRAHNFNSRLIGWPALKLLLTADLKSEPTEPEPWLARNLKTSLPTAWACWAVRALMGKRRSRIPPLTKAIRYEV